MKYNSTHLEFIVVEFTVDDERRCTSLCLAAGKNGDRKREGCEPPVGRTIHTSPQ